MKKTKSHSVNQRDVLDPARARAMQVALGLPGTLDVGDRLPPFFHQLYFWIPAPPQDLGRDGHPKVGGLIPDVGLPKRMWAGGRIKFFAPLLLGFPAERMSFCESVKTSEGRTGMLAFVTLRHEIIQKGVKCVTEWQELVYGQDLRTTRSKPTLTMASTDEDESVQCNFDTTLLFRYSALTFNGHRIHYDEPYAKSVEGYSGLVVHGPLLAQKLILMAEVFQGFLSDFSFRATAPLMHFETATLCRKGYRFWIRGPDGRQCMTAFSE